MSTFLRASLFLIGLSPLIALGADNKPAPVPAPAFMDVVSFEYRADDENHKVVVTSTPAELRFDKPDEGYSIIYNPATDSYTGLEHRNYTWWQFSWPEVRAAVENSQRYAKRLQDLGNDGLSGDSSTPPTPATNAPPDATQQPTSSAGSDGTGYVWRPTTDKKRISDFDCVKWTGETESGQNIEAWCYVGALPKVQAAIADLRKVNEPIALVPVREMAPDIIFAVYDTLIKGGVTPVQIDWGDNMKNHFRLVEAKSRDGKQNLFTVPNLYTKTTLITMDGMIDSQPAPGARHANPPTNSWEGSARPTHAPPPIAQ